MMTSFKLSSSLSNF